MSHHQTLPLRRRGAIAPLTAVLLIPLLGMVAFAVDLAWITHTQNDLQSAADAAALAGAAQLPDNFDAYYMASQNGQSIYSQSATQSAILTTAQNNAKSCAKQYAGYNAAGDVSSLALADADVEFGYTDASGNYTPQPAYTGYPNTVKVILRRDNTANGPLGLFFARALGTDSVNLKATAAATIYAGNLDSFQTANSSVMARILPMAYDVNHWNNFIQTGRGPDSNQNKNQNGDGNNKNQNGDGNNKNQNGDGNNNQNGDGNNKNQNGDGNNKNQNGDGNNKNQNGDGNNKNQNGDGNNKNQNGDGNNNQNSDGNNNNQNNNQNTDGNGNPVLAIYPSIKFTGNLGELSLDQATNGASTISAWIDYGVSTTDLQQGINAGLLPLSAHNSKSAPDWKGNPGLKTSTMHTAANHVGQVYLMPLFKPVNDGSTDPSTYQAGSGQGSQYNYTIVQFVAIKIVSATDNNITVMPVSGIIPNMVLTGVAPAGPPSSTSTLSTTFTGCKLSQ
jgi:Flp pilus assembly protein TadG